MSLISYLPIILPSILGYSSAMFCNVSKSSGSTVNFRPPAVVFSIVWIILYILIGVSWYMSREKSSNTIIIDLLYLLLNISLVSWIVLYSCINDKINAIYVLVICIMFAFFCYTVTNNIISKLTLIPLICWLFLAMLINIFEIQK